MRVTQRARNSRSWETSTTPVRSEETKDSSRCKPGQVQVVGGLVQQHHVEAAQQQRGQGHAGGLSAGERGHQRCRRAGSRPSSASIAGSAVLEVRGAGGHPVVEGGGVGVIGTRRPGTQGLGGGFHGLGCRGAAGAPGQVCGDGFAVDAFVFLRQPADEGAVRVRWRRCRPGVRRRRRAGAAAWTCRRRWRPPRR